METVAKRPGKLPGRGKNGGRLRTEMVVLRTGLPSLAKKALGGGRLRKPREGEKNVFKEN